MEQNRLLARLLRILAGIRGEKWSIAHYTAAIATLGLFLTAANFVVAVVQNMAVRERWTVEDEGQIGAELRIQNNLTPEGFRQAIVEFRRFLPKPIRIETVRLISPIDGAISYSADQAKPGIPPATQIDIPEQYGSEWPIPDRRGGGTVLLLRTLETPNGDQGAKVEIEVTFIDKFGSTRRYKRKLQGLVPIDAARKPT